MKRTIDVLTGIRYTPDMMIRYLDKRKKLEHLTYRHVNTVYSLCWVFQFRIALQATKNTVRYGGYYAGFDESVMSPGKLAFLPSAKPQEVEEISILPDRLTEEEALRRAWEYNRPAISRKFKALFAPPRLEDHVAERFYKPMYIIEFYNAELDEKKYRLLDSLTGDL